MKHTIDGVTITPELIKLLKDWAPASKIDMSVPAMHVKELVRVQDCLCRFLSMSTRDDERSVIGDCLGTLVDVKDDLERMTNLWKGGEL